METAYSYTSEDSRPPSPFRPTLRNQPSPSELAGASVSSPPSPPSTQLPDTLSLSDEAPSSKVVVLYVPPLQYAASDRRLKRDRSARDRLAGISTASTGAGSILAGDTEIEAAHNPPPTRSESSRKRRRRFSSSRYEFSSLSTAPAQEDSIQPSCTKTGKAHYLPLKNEAPAPKRIRIDFSLRDGLLSLSVAPTLAESVLQSGTYSNCQSEYFQWYFYRRSRDSCLQGTYRD